MVLPNLIPRIDSASSVNIALIFNISLKIQAGAVISSSLVTLYLC